MSLISLEEAIKNHKKIKGKRLIADTCFILPCSSIKSLKYSKKSKDFYKALHSNNRNHFFSTITIKQELLHHIRNELINTWIKEHKIKIPQENKKRMRFLKNFYWEMEKIGKDRKFLSFLKNKLTKRMKAYDNKFPYISGKKIKPRLRSKDLAPMMEKWGLDSSDAMIANFVIKSKRISGIVTCNSDFVCLKDSGKDVFMPKELIRPLI